MKEKRKEKKKKQRDRESRERKAKELGFNSYLDWCEAVEHEDYVADCKRRENNRG